MTDQTADYVSLKPIAERFKNVAAGITDNELRALIYQALRNQIECQINLGYEVSEIVEKWIDENTDFIENCIRDCVKEKFKN